MNFPTKKQEQFVSLHGLSPKAYTKQAYWIAIHNYIEEQERDISEPDDLDYEYAIPMEDTF